MIWNPSVYEYNYYCVRNDMHKPRLLVSPTEQTGFDLDLELSPHLGEDPFHHIWEQAQAGESHRDPLTRIADCPHCEEESIEATPIPALMSLDVCMSTLWPCPVVLLIVTSDIHWLWTAFITKHKLSGCKRS